MMSIKIEGTCGEVNIPITADGWELYSSMPGAEEAALRLAEAAEKAVKAPTRVEAIAIMGHALTIETRFGARDTEPRSVAEGILERGRGGTFAWML